MAARKKAITREKLLDIARAHFARFGYKKTVIDEIVKEAGIAKGTFYSYFKSKDALFLGVLDLLQEEAGQAFAEGMASSETATEQVRWLLQMSFQLLAEEPIMASLAMDDPELRFFREMAEGPDKEEEVQAAVGALRAILQSGIERGEFREDLDLERLPFVIGSFKFLHFHMDLVTGYGLISRDGWVETLTELVIKGLVKPASLSPQGGSADRSAFDPRGGT